MSIRLVPRQSLNSTVRERAYEIAKADIDYVNHSMMLEGQAIYDGSKGCVTGVVLERLTWEGHDFLDAARDDTIWKKAMKRFMQPTAAFTFGLLLEYLKKEAKAKLGLGGDSDAAS